MLPSSARFELLFENEGSLYELGYELMGSEIPPVLTTGRCRDVERDNLGIVKLHYRNPKFVSATDLTRRDMPPFDLAQGKPSTIRTY